MAVGPPAKRPAILAIGFSDRQVVDAGVPAAHESVLVELPVLITVGAKPRSAVVVPLVREANRDAVARECPDLLDETIVELAHPLALEKGDDLGASVDELRAVAPAAVLGVGEGDTLGLARVPRILGPTHCLGGRLGG